MKEDIYSKFKEIGENAKLSEAEMCFHREEILKFIESRPSPYNKDAKKASPFYFGLSLHRHLVLTSLAVIFIIGGGVTLSANSSLPNDFLYKIKTNINEPLMLFLTPSSQGKTSMKVALVNKRLREFSQVTLNKNLSSKEKVKFVNHLSYQIKDTQKEIVKLAEESNTGEAFHANNNLRSILATQDKILDKIHTTNPGADTSKFESMLDTSIKQTAQIEDQITNSVSIDETEIDQTINKLKEEINASLVEVEEAKQDLVKKEDNLDIIDQESFDNEIFDIRRDLELAEDKIEKVDKQEKLKLYNEIDKKLGKLKSLLEIKEHLKLETENKDI